MIKSRSQLKHEHSGPPLSCAVSIGFPATQPATRAGSGRLGAMVQVLEDRHCNPREEEHSSWEQLNPLSSEIQTSHEIP